MSFRICHWPCLTAVLLAVKSACLCPAAESVSSVYLFATSRQPQHDGLRFDCSRDGIRWTNIPGLFLKSRVEDGTMRNPSIARGPDGNWHLIWTTLSASKGFGYAHSEDLVHWSEQRFVSIGETRAATNSTPQLFYDESGRQFVVWWRSSIHGGYSAAVRTGDFKSFEDVTSELRSPAGLIRGNVFEAAQKDVDYLFKVGAQQVAGVRLPWVSPVSQSQIAARIAEIEGVAIRGPFKPDWSSITNQFRTPAWYQDAKFGVFIHWGVYSVPAFGSEWYPREMYVQGSKEFKHHVESYGPQANFGYKEFIPRFTAEKFDPEAWAELFKEAGVKYVVPVAEHHDGFPMYASGMTQWSAAKMGPKRDVIGEQAAAFRKAGMVFGASSHRAEHWFFFDNGMYFESDVRDTNHAALYGPAVNKRMAEAQAEPPDKAFLDDWLLRSCEIVDQYRPEVLYFDWWICQPVFQPYLKTFAAYYYNRGAEWGKQVAINFKEWEGRSFPRGAGVFDMERGHAGGIQTEFWQTCTSVSRNSWGYITNHNYKPAGEIVDDLVDIVSKNGTMLLNIGPKPDGTIPEEEQQMLRQIGAWLKVNGEAIYGTRPWTSFGEGPTQLAKGSFSDQRSKPEFTAEDFRFTTNDTTLYAIALAWPQNSRLLVKSLPTGSRRVRQVSLLGYPGVLSWQQTPEGLRVDLPASAPCDFAVTLKIQEVIE